MSPYAYAHSNSYLIIPSPTYIPNPAGDSCIIATYSLPSMLPHFFRVRDNSTMSILAAITALHARVSSDSTVDHPFRSIVIDPAYLNSSDAAVIVHSQRLDYRIIARIPLPDDALFPPFIHPIASAPPDDPRALHMLSAAYSCLYSDRYTSPSFGRLSHSPGI